MKTRGGLIVVTLTTLVLGVAIAQQARKRVRWDQKEAVAKVKGLLEMEKAGTPWNDIDWHHDIDKAAKLAKEQNKPLFVYFYLKKNLGPVTDPG